MLSMHLLSFVAEIVSDQIFRCLDFMKELSFPPIWEFSAGLHKRIHEFRKLGVVAFRVFTISGVRVLIVESRIGAEVSLEKIIKTVAPICYLRATDNT
jgi:hypothetical protein